MATGRVYLIGAGPGSPELITLRGFRAVRQADVVICDYLLPASFFEELGIPMARKKLIRIEPGKTRTSQEDINAMMVAEAKAGHIVARLKGGDPFVFGRGKEEIDYLIENDVPWELIPGLTVGTAGPALATLPLTFRRESRSLALVTAKLAGGAPNESFPYADSMVFFMGVALFDEITARLTGEGWPADTPAVVIERATQPWEKRVGGTLATIAQNASRMGVEAPAILVVGGAAAHYGEFKDRPRILYTGLDPSNFRLLGDVVHWPALRTVRHEEGWQRLPRVIAELKAGRYDAVVFTSKVGVRSFFEAVAGVGLDSRILAGRTVTTAGAGTAMQLLDYGIVADAVAAAPGSAGILQSFVDLDLKDLLVIQGFNAPKVLEENLRARGLNVLRLSLHDVVPNPDLGRPLPEHDVIYFTSPSGVKACVQAYGDEAFRKTVWCIGDVTLERVLEHTSEASIVYPDAGD